jgi:hypothetical protein
MTEGRGSVSPSPVEPLPKIAIIVMLLLSIQVVHHTFLQALKRIQTDAVPIEQCENLRLY